MQLVAVYKPDYEFLYSADITLTNIEIESTVVDTVTERRQEEAQNLSMV